MESRPPAVIDSHCHLDFPEFDADRANVIARAKAAGIACVVNAASTVETSVRGAALAAENDFVRACAGCHPHDAEAFTRAGLDTLDELCAARKVVAVGEIGLDYYRNLSSPANQRRVFETLLDLAIRRDMPVVIHSREAQADTLDVLRQKKVRKAIIHCFSGGTDFLNACLDLGFYVSFTCTITYKKADAVREAVKQCPLDRICVETDAPYLPPEGRRGTRNEPAAAADACRKVAELKGIPFEEAAAATTANARRFFGL